MESNLHQVQDDIRRIVEAFVVTGTVTDICPYGNGHINDTYLVTTSGKRYILQRVNRYVFKEPVQVIRNIELVTGYLRDRNCPRRRRPAARDADAHPHTQRRTLRGGCVGRAVAHVPVHRANDFPRSAGH